MPPKQEFPDPLTVRGRSFETEERIGADLDFELTGPPRTPSNEFDVAGDPIGSLDPAAPNWFGSYALDDGLRSAVYLSIFTDRLADESDELPDSFASDETVPDRRGYWADFLSPIGPDDRMGSRLWLLRGQTLTRDTRARARSYVLEALRWLETEGIGKASVEVELPRKEDEARRRGVLELAITVTDEVAQRSRRFDFVWDAMVREGV